LYHRKERKGTSFGCSYLPGDQAPGYQQRSLKGAESQLQLASLRSPDILCSGEEDQSLASELAIETLRQDVEVIMTLFVCVPLADKTPVQLENTGSKLPVAPKNPHLGVFSL
jgi:hypothetical protein